MFNTLNAFLSLLFASNAISVDGGSLLEHWEKGDLTGQPDNEILFVSWTDGECNFSEKFTEGGLSAGKFAADGSFICENSEGERAVFRFFKLERLGMPTIVSSGIVALMEKAVILWPTATDEMSAYKLTDLASGMGQTVPAFITACAGNDDYLADAIRNAECFDRWHAVDGPEADFRALHKGAFDSSAQLVTSIPFGLNAEAIAEIRNENEDSASTLATVQFHGEKFELRICSIGTHAYLEWINEGGDPIGDVFDDLEPSVFDEFLSALCSR